MHYFKQQRQSDGWKGDFYVFEKKKFIKEFYMPHKENIPNNYQHGFDYLKSSLPKYLTNKKSRHIFKTKFMDIKTEDSIDYKLTKKDIEKNAKISKTTLIENKFEIFLRNKNNNQNPELLKYPTFKEKQLQQDDVIAYFALQCSRTPLNLFAFFDIFTKNHPIKYTKEYALMFREFYNKQYLKIFSEKYNYLMANKDDLLFAPLQLPSKKSNIKNFITLSEYNTINLLQYKKLSPFLKKYPDALLANIDMTIVSSNTMYFCIKTPSVDKTIDKNINIINEFNTYQEPPFALAGNPRELSFYKELLKEVQETWNTFSISLSHEHLICSKQEDFLNFITNNLYYHHINGNFATQYSANNHIDSLLYLEKFLK